MFPVGYVRGPRHPAVMPGTRRTPTASELLLTLTTDAGTNRRPLPSHAIAAELPADVDPGLVRGWLIRLRDVGLIYGSEGAGGYQASGAGVDIASALRVQQALADGRLQLVNRDDHPSYACAGMGC